MCNCDCLQHTVFTYGFIQYTALYLASLSGVTSGPVIQYIIITSSLNLPKSATSSESSSKSSKTACCWSEAELQHQSLPVPRFLCITSVTLYFFSLSGCDGENGLCRHHQWTDHVLPPGCSSQRHQCVSGCHAGFSTLFFLTSVSVSVIFNFTIVFPGSSLTSLYFTSQCLCAITSSV